MKARIIKDSCDYYIGEVHGIWYNWMLGIERTGWNRVTKRCMTEWGANRELKKWKQKNCPKESEI